MADGSGSAYWVTRIIGLAEREGRAQRHPVVLMHNQPAGNPATVRALPVITEARGPSGSSGRTATASSRS